MYKSDVIDELQKKLNSQEFVPARGYRRNVTIYSLVSYINNITGCYLSENSKPIVVFIDRARNHMTEYPPTEEWREYYEMARSYLDMVENHLRENGIDINGN